MNAPAKINLYLHVTGKRDDNYHFLDTLVVFANIGDRVTITESNQLSMSIDGEFASHIAELPMEENLVIKAIRLLANKIGYKPDFHINLTKDLPPASGIGGGSADAVATLKEAMKYWGISETASFLPEILLELGADVPICFYGKASRVHGIGEIITPLPEALPPLYSVLVNPLVIVPTKKIFSNFSGEFKPAITHFPKFNDIECLYKFLKEQENSLLSCAMDEKPVIAGVLKSIDAQIGCRLARMSGSGATCFGLFDDELHAQRAVKSIKSANPNWWVRSTIL